MDDFAWFPRVVLNYRFNDTLVARAGASQSIARPAIGDLVAGNAATLFLAPAFGPNANQPALFVSQGNPGLKPAISSNFDLGIEWYDSNAGVLKFGVFYKTMENLLETNTFQTDGSLQGVDLPDDPRFQALPDNIYVEFSRPENNPDRVSAYGAEFAVERRFTGLPGFWSGLGAYANYVYARSYRDVTYNWNRPLFDPDTNAMIGSEAVQVVEEDVPFDYASRHSGTAALTYNRHGFDASLAWSFQGRRYSTIRQYGTGSFIGAIDSLDMRVEYFFLDSGVGDVSVFFEGADLLRGADEAVNLRGAGGYDGSPGYYVSGAYRGGRSFRFGMTGRF